jgi:hypothetical protein
MGGLSCTSSGIGSLSGSGPQQSPRVIAENKFRRGLTLVIVQGETPELNPTPGGHPGWRVGGTSSSGPGKLGVFTNCRRKYSRPPALHPAVKQRAASIRQYRARDFGNACRHLH